MDDHLRIDVSAGRITLSGEMTQVNAAQLAEALGASDALEVDLSSLTFVDSAGMSALLQAIDTRPGLRILNPPLNISRAFELSGLSHVFDDAGARGVELPEPGPAT